MIMDHESIFDYFTLLQSHQDNSYMFLSINTRK